MGKKVYRHFPSAGLVEGKITAYTPGTGTGGGSRHDDDDGDSMDEDGDEDDEDSGATPPLWHVVHEDGDEEGAYFYHGFALRNTVCYCYDVATVRTFNRMPCGRVVLGVT